jgi:hypothetical protein
MSVAQVNRESRQILLKTRNSSFSGILNRPVYFDFSEDMLSFKHEQAVERFAQKLEETHDQQGVKQKLRYIKVEMERESNLHMRTYRLICDMTNLETVVVVLDEVKHSLLLGTGFEDAERLVEKYIHKFWHK